MTGPGPIPPSDFLPEALPVAKWPDAVQRPGSPGFERSARAWLFDFVPAQCRYEEILHRHTVELARLVRLRLEAGTMTMDAGLRALENEPEPADDEFFELTDLYRRERDWAANMLEQVKLVQIGLTGGEVHSGARHHPPDVRSWIVRFPTPQHAAG